MTFAIDEDGNDDVDDDDDEDENKVHQDDDDDDDDSDPVAAGCRFNYPKVTGHNYSTRRIKG